MEHHAVCFVGNEFARSALESLLTSRSPDTHILNQTDFGIADARELARLAYLSPVEKTEQVFIIFTNTLTIEAQNALLKLFEEPPVNTRFNLVVPKLGILLPTLQSRLQIEQATNLEDGRENKSFETFRDSTYGERLELVAKVAKEKDWEIIEAIMSGSEKVATGSGDQGLLKTVCYMRSQLGNRGASTKMLLESLALALPRK